MFTITLQIPLKTTIIHQLPLNTYPSQKKNKQQNTNITNLQNKNHNNYNLTTKSKHI